MIPKIIHFIWINFNNELDENPVIPKELSENIDICKKINKGYEIKIWNGKECYELVKQYFPNKYDIFINFRYPIMRCDMARLIILYIYGGIYSDLDRVSIKSYDEIVNKYIDYDVIFSGIQHFLPIKFINNDLIIANKGSNFIYQCIQNISEKRTNIYLVDIHGSAGSGYLFFQYYNNNTIDKIIIISELNVCNFCNKCDINKTQNIISYSTYAGSWLSDDDLFTKISIQLFCKLQLIFFLILIIIVIYICLKYNKKILNKLKKILTFFNS